MEVLQMSSVMHVSLINWHLIGLVFLFWNYGSYWQCCYLLITVTSLY